LHEPLTNGFNTLGSQQEYGWGGKDHVLVAPERPSMKKGRYESDQERQKKKPDIRAPVVVPEAYTSHEG
jgi:hypothetical protein